MLAFLSIGIPDVATVAIPTVTPDVEWRVVSIESVRSYSARSIMLDNSHILEPRCTTGLSAFQYVGQHPRAVAV